MKSTSFKAGAARPGLPFASRARVACLSAIAGAALMAASLATGTAAAQSVVAPESREQIRLSFAPVVQQVAPAVVNIFSRKTVTSTPYSPFFDDPFFRQFFGNDSPFFGGARQRIEQSLGSGVVIRPNGIVVTNNHVVEGADEITVVLNDYREFPAQIVGTDQRTDLAVLRIDTEGEALPYLEPADSDRLAVGDLVIAVGNPFGVGQTVTSGIVSALARSNVGVSDFQSFIQTDAAINPGNSGGGLVTVDGRLVGINTAIFTRGGGSIGIGFAIPSNMVRAVVRSILDGGMVARPWLGAWGQRIDADMAASLGLRRPVGLILINIHPSSPVAAAGISVGDVVDSVDGFEVVDEEALDYRIATAAVGDRVTLGGIFDGARDERTVTLIGPPEEPNRDTTLLDGQHPLAGATVANLNPALAEELGLDGAAAGVIVLEVAQTSPAERLGVRRGDVLVSVAEDDVTSVAHLRDVVSTARRHWPISIRRGDRLLSVVVQG